MAIYKRSRSGRIVNDDEEGVFYYDFVVEGRRYKKALVGIRTRKQAEKIEEKRRFAVYAGDDVERDKRITFKEFVEKVYLPYQKRREIRSYYNYKCFCTQVCAFKFFKNKLIQEIERDPDLIEKWVEHRSQTCRRNTVNREKGMLSGIFGVAVKKRYIKSNPCKSVDSLPNAPNQRTATLSPEDEARLLEVLSGKNEKYRPVVLLGLHTGMRLNAILNLQWSWIDLIAGEINLPQSINKNKKTHTVVLNQVALTVLKQLREKSASGKRVFPNSRGSGFSRGHVSKIVSDACDQIGVPDATMHATRRTFNTRLIEKNTNPFVVKELMGHSSLQMTDHYTHLGRETLREAVKTLEKQPAESLAVPERSEDASAVEVKQ